jgi:hypothetical protein
LLINFVAGFRSIFGDLPSHALYYLSFFASAGRTRRFWPQY